jgi:hypothetical protein
MISEGQDLDKAGQMNEWVVDDGEDMILGEECLGLATPRSRASSESC